MARQAKRRKNDEQDGGEAPGSAPTKLGPPPRLEGSPTTAAAWFEEAWNGWMKPVGGILLVIVAYLGYTGNYLREDAAGRIVLALVVGLAIYSAVEPALGRVRTPRERYLVFGFAGLWAVIAIAPLLQTVFPGKVLGETTIGMTKEATAAAVTIDGGSAGPYEVTVSGRLRGSGEAEASYDIEIAGNGDSTDRIAGELKRTYFNQRVSRRSAASVAVRTEQTERVHRVTVAKGPALKMSGEVGSEQLEDGLHLTFRAAGPSPGWFFLAGLLLFVAGVVIDYRMLAPRAHRTHFSTATGFTLVFATYCAWYSEGMTPHNLVRPALAGVLAAGALGAGLGWLISAAALSFKAQPKKLAGVKNRFAEETEAE